MLIILEQKASHDQLLAASQDLNGYIKFVVDLDKKVITIGGLRHVEGEQLLLQKGSKQSDLWGGGYDLETQEIDFESMINIRPAQNNPSREVLDSLIRDQIFQLAKKFLLHDQL